jgi:serine/threonine-protein kinase
MGTIWLARLTGKHGFERLVALKTILSTHSSDRQFCDMFLDEARIAAQIDHENVARILEIGEDRGVLYHAMELIDGESLRKLYRDIRAVGAPFPLAVALRISADLCAGLHAVHELRAPDGMSLEVVHRDVSPQNVLVTVRGTIKLIDFGVAKARERRTEDTTAGTLKGKLEYMAPEQACGEPIDRRADVYAVGAVLYELLCGEPVRSTHDGRQLLALHELMTGAPYEPLHHSIPVAVRAIVDRALARDPLLRFRTAEEMRHALEQAMVTIGSVATTDDVANVLGHFSRERIQQRKDAIDAALRIAQALEREQSGSGRRGRASTRTVVAPLSSPGNPTDGQLLAGPGGTQVIGVAELAAQDGPGSGPSMRTMQGASLSGSLSTVPPGMSAGKVFSAILVLGVVAVLGVAGGVLATRNGVMPAAGNPATQGTSIVTAPVTTVGATSNAAGDAEAAAVVVPPTLADPSTGTVIGASDAGQVSTSPVPTTATNPGTPSVRTVPTRKATNKSGAHGSGPKPERDEYGF